MSVSGYVARRMASASWIRRMFEASREMRARLGDENVFDLSLGNPVLEPPPAFFEALREVAGARGRGDHRYMPNAGFPAVREAIAGWVRRQGICDVSPGGVILSVGAGGALNVALKAILDPGDEVVLLAPYFVEYEFYVENHGGRPVVVQTDSRFEPDVSALEGALGPCTKAVLINSPNNPSGRVYDAERMHEVVDCLRRAEKRLGRAIYLISDEPYRAVTYDVEVPPFLRDYDNAMLVYSWSKALSVPGDRIGFVAAADSCQDRRLPDALTFATRILGFVNAPATMQLAVLRLLDAPAPVAAYRALRDRLAGGLRAAGYDFVLPEGAFYMFPRSPIPDDQAFVQRALEERVVVVPGSGFGRPGHFRISYAVDEAQLAGGIEALARARRKA